MTMQNFPRIEHDASKSTAPSEEVLITMDTTTFEGTPTKIWINILHHCDYFTLKKLYLVSKVFGDLLSSKIFDSALFRFDSTQAEPKPHSESKQYRLHPVLQYAGHFLDKTPRDRRQCLILDFRIQSKHSGKSWPFIDSSIVSESATMPPVMRAKLSIDFGALGDHAITDLDSGKAAGPDASKIVRVQDVYKVIHHDLYIPRLRSYRLHWPNWIRHRHPGVFVGWREWKKGELGPNNEERKAVDEGRLAIVAKFDDCVRKHREL